MVRAAMRAVLATPALLVLVGGLGLGGGFPGFGSASALVLAIECPPAATPGAASTVADSAAAPPVAATERSVPETGGELTVFAAASLTDAFGQIKTALEAANPGLTIAYNFAGSQALVTQLNAGAAADVFASANNAQMDAAIANGSIAGEPVTFVRNRLAIVVPADNPAGLETPADLGDEGLRLVLAQPEVPVGRYARQAVCLMAQDVATFGEGFGERVAANVVSAEEDVRSVLAKVQLGEADAGIVYVSAAAAVGDDVRQIAIPTEFNLLATYSIAAVAGGERARADAFIAYVLSPEGQATLQGFGFEPIA